MTRTDPLRFLEATDVSADAEAAKVTEFLEVFDETKLTRRDASRDHLLQLNLTIHDLEKCVKAVTGYVTQKTFDDLWARCHNAGSVTSAQEMTLRDLFRFRKWLGTPTGQNAVREIQHRKKLTKSGKSAFTADEMALKRLFTSEHEDLTREVAEEAAQRDNILARCRAKMERARAAFLEREAEIQRKYPVAGGYADPPVEVIKAEAWEMYLADCQKENKVPVVKSGTNLDLVFDKYGSEVRDRHLFAYLSRPEVKATLIAYGNDKIKRLRDEGKERALNTFAPTWHSRVESLLMRFPLELRRRMLQLVPVGRPPTTLRQSQSRPLKMYLKSSLVLVKSQLGTKPGPPLPRKIEGVVRPLPLLDANRRVRLRLKSGSLRNNSIPMGRSRFEAGIRHIIGGGELKTWRIDNKKYRGGGNLFDALLLLANADDSTAYKRLGDFISADAARAILRLPNGLPVPDGPACCLMKQYNDEATAGPLFRAFGVKGKYGLKSLIEEFVWSIYDDAGSGRLKVDQMPVLLARVGYRSKLLAQDEAFKKMKNMKPLGRAVMMLDASEQAFSSPLFNIISNIVADLNKQKESGWRNYLVRASSSWIDLWDEVSASGSIVELDWSKFDRERPREDIMFFIDVIVSCFSAESMRERRLLAAYRKMMERALVDRVMVLDDGSCFTLDGMVPSGSLWTGICDTALNILYITVALRELGFSDSEFSPKCAGDDNLTLFTNRVSKNRLGGLRTKLNEMFRAGIEPEDFFVHYGPYHVTTEQACFPPGTDLSKGTSKIKYKADWVEFEGAVNVDEPMGRSHRWEYKFDRRPKFLANFFLPDGRPIRPAHDNLERLLWPEGLHKSLDDYEMAIMAMIVDNPFNHHNVNHMMVRYLVAWQLKRQAFDLDEELVLDLCSIRDKSGGPIPYPEVAYWRRGGGGRRFEDEEQFRPLLSELQTFIATVSTLYARRSEGGIDSWRFMAILRGEDSIGAGQFGNDVHEWCRFLGGNPLTKSLRAARRFRPAKEHPKADQDTTTKAKAALAWCKEFCFEHPIVGPLHFSSEVCNLLAESPN
ncbi:TPA_asm: fusion protein [Alloteropsis angusta amalgavirus 1]|nr:TPA_asm: fusion protein [Alloteropsis angusta amalgavirus 1]